MAKELQMRLRLVDDSNTELQHDELGVSPLLLLHLGLSDGNIVQITKLVDIQDLENRFVKLRCITISNDDECQFDGFITQLFLFNICHGNKNPGIYRKSMNILKVIIKTNVDHLKLPICQKITVKSITHQNMQSTELEKIDTALKSYFKSKRLCSKSDLFFIQIHGNNMQMFCCWFIIDGLEYDNPNDSIDTTPSTAWVSTDLSSLNVAGSFSCYVPRNLLNNASVLLRNCQVLFSSKLQEVQAIFQPAFTNNSMSTKEALLLLYGPHGSGKSIFAKMLAENLCIDYIELNCYNIKSESIAAVEQRLDKTFSYVNKCGPCVFFLRNAHKLGRVIDNNEEEPRIVNYFKRLIDTSQALYPIIYILSCQAVESMTPGILSLSSYQLEIPAPTEMERQQFFELVSDDIQFDSNDLARKTAGLVLGDILHIINSALLLSNSNQTLYQQITETLTTFSKEKSDSLGLARVPTVRWEDIGGLASVKDDIMDTIDLPIKYPELLCSGLNRSGLLFYGPPGCGKTLLAKAVACEFQLNFFSVKGPELINMYVGQSEENVRKVFQRARNVSPCVIFFDELDALAPNRGRSGDSGGVSDRIVSQLLSELDGLSTNAYVFVIGATNRPDLLDPALLRPGRFDKLVYVGVSKSKDDRIKILQALTRKMNLSDDVILSDIVDLCAMEMTGADYYAVCADAVSQAIKREITIRQSNANTVVCDDKNLVITLADFTLAIASIEPSISPTELARYERIKESFENK